MVETRAKHKLPHRYRGQKKDEMILWDGGGVGDEAANAEDHTTCCGEEEPVCRRSNTEYAHTERERERERHKEVSLIKNATVTT